jgi:hypothetical protein
MRVFLEDGDIWAEIAPRLHPLRITGGHAGLNFTVAEASGKTAVFRESQCIACEDRVTAARAILLQAMVSHREPLAILHAGGCAGVLLAGSSYSGKSTLCAALMAGGLPYHCDDSAVIDHDFHLHSMPFPLVLRRGSWPLIEARLPAFRQARQRTRHGSPVRFLEPENVTGPAAVRALVSVQYEDGVMSSLSTIDTFDALLALQNSGFWVGHTESGIQRFLAWLGAIPKYRLHYSRLQDAEALIGDLAQGAGANGHAAGIGA